MYVAYNCFLLCVSLVHVLICMLTVCDHYCKKATLSYRRLRGDLIEAYKILHYIYDPDAIKFLKLWSDCAPDMPLTRGQVRNPLRLFNNTPRLNLRKYSFSVRVVKAWNELEEGIINAPSVNSFKNRLDKYYMKKDIYYDNFKGTGTE